MFRSSSKRNGYRIVPLEERQHLREHFRRLSEIDRRHRFDPGIEAEELRVLFNRKRPVHDAIGWFQDGVVRGAVEIYYQDDRAKVGLTLEEEWRGIGIGTELVRHAMQRARSQGAKSLAMPFNRSNKSMTEIAAMLSSSGSFGHWRKAEPTEANSSVRAWIDFDLEDPADEHAAGGFIGKLKDLLSRLRG